MPVRCARVNLTAPPASQRAVVCYRIRLPLCERLCLCMRAGSVNVNICHYLQNVFFLFFCAFNLMILSIWICQRVITWGILLPWNPQRFIFQWQHFIVLTLLHLRSNAPYALSHTRKLLIHLQPFIVTERVRVTHTPCWLVPVGGKRFRKSACLMCVSVIASRIFIDIKLRHLTFT